MPVSRRRLLVLGGALVAAPVIAYSQGDRRVRRIGIIDYSAAEPGRLGWWKAFRQRLGELGYVEGKNLVVEARFAAGSEAQLAALAAELVKLKVELIATGGTITALAVRKATHDIPIVTATGIDPLRVGLVKTLARPGTNVTGVVSLNDQLAAKRLELLRTFVPKVSRIGLLWDETNPSSKIQLKDTEDAARTMGITKMVRGVKNAADFEPAMAALAKEGSHALIAIPSPAMFSNRALIGQLALKHRLPTMGGARQYAQAGALVSYATDYPHLFRRAAEYADKILKGANPAELPIEQPTKFELIINLHTAKALGISIPQSLLVRADEVIQ